MGRLRYIRLSGRQRLAIWSALIVLVLTTVACMAVIHMEPILVSMATARVSNTVNRIVVEAVNDAIQGGEIDYGILVEFEKDAEGRVTALKSNMAAFNRLQSRIADDILLRLSEVSTTTLAIPIGTLTGSSLLAGRGPALKVRCSRWDPPPPAFAIRSALPASTRPATRSCWMCR